MKSSKISVAFILALIIINVSVFGSIQVFAHDAMLDVDYDNCQKDLNGDGINEMWYILNFLKEGILI